LQNLGRQRREIAEVWTMIVTATPRMSEHVARMERSAIRDNSNTAPDFAALHPGYARFDCRTIKYLFTVVLTKTLSLFWRQALKTRGVAAGTHSRS
jgi:hypothetical protein